MESNIVQSWIMGKKWMVFFPEIFSRILIDMDVHVCMLSCFIVSDSLRPPWTVAHQAPPSMSQLSFLLPWGRGRSSSWPRDRTRVSCDSCFGRWIFLRLSHLGRPNDTDSFHVMACYEDWKSVGGKWTGGCTQIRRPRGEQTLTVRSVVITS